MMTWFDSRRVHFGPTGNLNSKEVNILDHVYLVMHESPVDKLVRGVYEHKSDAYRKIADCVRTIETHAGNVDEHDFWVVKRAMQ